MKILLKYFLLVLNNVFFDVYSMKDEEVFSKNQQNQNSKLFNVEYINNLSIKKIRKLLVIINNYTDKLKSLIPQTLDNDSYFTLACRIVTFNEKVYSARQKMRTNKKAIFDCFQIISESKTVEKGKEFITVSWDSKTIEEGIELITQLKDYLNECLVVKKQEFQLQKEKEEEPYLFHRQKNQKIETGKFYDQIDDKNLLAVVEEKSIKNEGIDIGILTEVVQIETEFVNFDDPDVLKKILNILKGSERRVSINIVQLEINHLMEDMRNLLNKYPEYKQKNFNLVIDNVNQVNNDIYKILSDILVILKLNNKTTKDNQKLLNLDKKVSDCQTLIDNSNRIFREAAVFSNKNGLSPWNIVHTDRYHKGCEKMFDVQTEISESINNIIENHQIVTPFRWQEKQALDSLYKLNKLKSAKK